jgi:hypothetical protein
MALLLGMVIGVALGLLVIGFIAIGAYERGYDAAIGAFRRRELEARRRPLAHDVTATAA